MFLLYIVKRNFFPGEIIFYEGLFFVIYVGIFLQVILYYFRIRLPIVTASLAFLLFTSLVPTILDRSVSITVLTALDDCGNCRIQDIHDTFNKIYINEIRAVEKRLAEQIYSKNVLLSDDSYSFTSRGQMVYNSIKYFTKLFAIDNSYLSKAK